MQPSAQGSSGRSAATLWGLFCRYKKSQSETIEGAFLDAGYDATNVARAVTGAINALGLDLPAHGTGGTDSGTQGDLDTVAATWVSKLTQWAASNPRSGGSSSSSGLRDESLHEKKLVAKEKKREDKHDTELHSGDTEVDWEDPGINWSTIFTASKKCKTCDKTFYLPVAW